MSNDYDEVSPGGSPIHRHRDENAFTAASEGPNVAAIAAHIAQHLGAVAGVYHEIISDTVRIDLHVVAATDAFPFLRIVTSGMSDLPMDVPEGAESPDRLELMVTLPGTWPLSETALADERSYWPLRLLKTLARLPHKYDTWLGFGHSIPNGMPAEPYATTVGFQGALILPPASAPDAFAHLTTDDGTLIGFMAVVPVYPEEMALKLEDDAQALLARFSAKGISDIIDPVRLNVGATHYGLHS